MSRVIKINFTDVNFHIKEFQKVYILENCKLCFYKPFHLQTEDKNSGKKFEDKEGKIHQEKEIKKINSQDQLNEKADIVKEQAKDYAQKIDEEINKLDENNFTSNIQTQTIEKRQDKFKNYDIFYDVYTSKDNDIKSLNEELKYNNGFEVKDGIAEVGADFFDKCFEKGIYVLIPRLVSLDKNETLHFDPVPLEDKGFVVTDFRKGKKGKKNIDLSFQRSIAKIKNPNLALQSPKEFLQALNENRDFTEDDKIQQAMGIKKACGKKADEMTKILLKDDKSLKDIITDEDKLKEKIKELQKEPETNEKLSLLGRLEFLQRNQDKAKKHKSIIKDLQNPQKTSNSKQDSVKNVDPLDMMATNSTTPNQEEQKNKNINSKDIGDAGEYAASMLFTKRSTRYLSNRRKLDANFNTKGFNHAIPDFLVTLNDYPTLVEVKNVKDQALTEQISFELKLAREYELDYLFLCNHYTKLIDNITNLEIFNKDNKDHKGSRSGFIYHRHFHRSIKTIFKEMYLHHIKGATPNKIMIKRLNLNNPANIEEELNKNKQIQKN
ncbi:putative toxin [Campylobacter lari]|uniref:putative toxin n=1 Tax=Campylobacter lari TaxID=201 RepID=UPI0021530297|nr:putative toxin [Campylobacter lari]MCR6519470.1 putative toxin [Campylobacter lari]